jgi:hypothetical protein
MASTRRLAASSSTRRSASIPGRVVRNTGDGMLAEFPSVVGRDIDRALAHGSRMCLRLSTKALSTLFIRVW